MTMDTEEKQAHERVLGTTLLNLVTAIDAYYTRHGKGNPNFEAPYPFLGTIDANAKASIPRHEILLEITENCDAKKLVQIVRTACKMMKPVMAFVVNEGFSINMISKLREKETLVINLETMDGGVGFAIANINRSGEDLKLDWLSVTYGGDVKSAGTISNFFQQD